MTQSGSVDVDIIFTLTKDQPPHFLSLTLKPLDLCSFKSSLLSHPQPRTAQAQRLLLYILSVLITTILSTPRSSSPVFFRHLILSVRIGSLGFSTSSIIHPHETRLFCLWPRSSCPSNLTWAPLTTVFVDSRIIETTCLQDLQHSPKGATQTFRTQIHPPVGTKLSAASSTAHAPL